jgi:hypothetical protein
LLAKAVEEQQQSGYFYALPEICRQPQTWRETCELTRAPAWTDKLHRQQQPRVVCFISSDQTRQGYETDLVRELSRKRLGLRKMIVGEAIPTDVTGPEDVVVEYRGLKQSGDRNAVLVDAVVAQSLAFFRCMQDGLHPDSPSRGNVINRVVQRFPLYGT